MGSHDTLIAPARAARGGAVLDGRYRLAERLGAGGFGVVWRAYDTLLQRDVAVKAIPLPAGEDRARATREALATARLAHPAIVALYEARAEGGDFYLVTELVEGDTLAELIARDALADEEILEIGCALADALLHAHGRGVVHRDLKPHNVLVPRAAARPAVPAKLTDFGGALLAGEEGLTRTGDVLGTLAYMAPEQIEGAEVTECADLYSLALVLHEALTGTNPVRGPTPAATVRRIGRALPLLADLRRELPRELTRALDRALRPDPHARGSLDELRAALARARRSGWQAVPGRQLPPTSRGAPYQALTIPHQTPATDYHLAPVADHYRAPATDRHRAPAADHRLAPVVDPEGQGERESFPWPPASVERSSTDPAAQDADGWLTFPRLCWLAGTLALCIWQLTAGRPGLALLVGCAALPLALAVRRPGPRWLAPALAPVLGLTGLAGAFPALAGQAAQWRVRALLGALGYWWLRLAELPLDRAGWSPLWLGVPAGLAGRPHWERSLSVTAAHALVPLLGVALLLGAALWAAAAVLLPWVVRGRHATLDVLAAALWAAALAASAPLLDRGAPLLRAGTAGMQPGRVGAQAVILGALAGAALAVAARALRGPV